MCALGCAFSCEFYVDRRLFDLTAEHYARVSVAGIGGTVVKAVFTRL